MTTSNPLQQLANDIRSLQFEVNDLQESVRLQDVYDTLEDLQTQVSGLTQRIANLRAGGYVFEKELENQAATFLKQWDALRPSLQQELHRQTVSLQASMQSIEAQMARLHTLASTPTLARPLLTSLQSNVSMLKDKVSAAERTVHGMYDQFDTTVYQFRKHLSDIEYMLTNLAEASFPLLPTEAGIAAVKAVWCRSGKEQKGDPEGVLFLTDQRLLFEHKEEVATKKVLFVTTETKKVQGLLFEIPVALVDTVLTGKAGLLKNEDHIEIHFRHGAPYQSLRLHIWQDGQLWQRLLNQAKAKEFDKDRVVAIDEAVIEKMKSVPAKCPSCGATMDVVVLRGQDTVKCAHCGTVIRL